MSTSFSSKQEHIANTIQTRQPKSLPCRFPRYIRSREDKLPEDASSPEVIVDLYNKQTRKMSSAKELLEAQAKRDRAEDAAQEVKPPSSSSPVLISTGKPR